VLGQILLHKGFGRWAQVYSRTSARIPQNLGVRQP
jgi:hypothetical protein